jgi:UDP-N-acetylmuramate--alanine ligase
MHIYFSGIGGAGIGPLALIAHQAGFTVSGSDKQPSQYITYLQQKGLDTIHIGQTEAAIAEIHANNPIDWLVMSSAVPIENPNHPELVFATANGIKITKRDELINVILSEKNLKMLAVAGTHGKTTTTAMLIWACKQLQIPVSYSVGAKISFGDMGHYNPESEYFIYECDEFDRNFLHFSPAISLITSADWDHHDIYATEQDYKDAFKQFISQSAKTFAYEDSSAFIGVEGSESVRIIPKNNPDITTVELAGAHNRTNAYIAALALSEATQLPVATVIDALNSFPGSQRRFEQLAPNIYTDYAHTPEEISATLQLAHELSDEIVVVYEPLTNKRQHYMKDMYRTIFETVKNVYWLPTYLAREDPAQHVFTPQEFITGLSEQTTAEPAELNIELLDAIHKHAANGALVLCLAGGGGGSLDEFLRANLKVQ